jgi:hypothetical protein
MAMFTPYVAAGPNFLIPYSPGVRERKAYLDYAYVCVRSDPAQWAGAGPVIFGLAEDIARRQSPHDGPVPNGSQSSPPVETRLGAVVGCPAADHSVTINPRGETMRLLHILDELDQTQRLLEEFPECKIGYSYRPGHVTWTDLQV